MKIPKISLSDNSVEDTPKKNNFYMTEVINIHFDVVITDDKKRSKVYCVAASMRGLNLLDSNVYTNTFYTSIRAKSYEEIHAKLNQFLASTFVSGAAVIRDYDVYELDTQLGPVLISSGVWPIFSDYDLSLQLTKQEFNEMILNGV